MFYFLILVSQHLVPLVQPVYVRRIQTARTLHVDTDNTRSVNWHMDLEEVVGKCSVCVDMLNDRVIHLDKQIFHIKVRYLLYTITKHIMSLTYFD